MVGLMSCVPGRFDTGDDEECFEGLDVVFACDIASFLTGACQRTGIVFRICLGAKHARSTSNAFVAHRDISGFEPTGDCSYTKSRFVSFREYPRWKYRFRSSDCLIVVISSCVIGFIVTGMASPKL